MIARTPAMRRTQAEIIGRGIQIQNYAYAVHDEAFESLIRRMEKEMHQKMDAATKACLRQSMIDPSKNPVVSAAGENTFCPETSGHSYAALLPNEMVNHAGWKLEPISGFAEVEPGPEPVDTDYLLHDISTLIRRQVVLGETPARRRPRPHPPAWVAASPTDTPPPPVQSRIRTAAACKRDRTA
jgi:hypothetical protein